MDLDGSLIDTDILHESALGILRSNPRALLSIPYWLSRGKATLKEHLAKHTQLHLGSLPYNNDLIQWLKQQKTTGRTLILYTASHRSIANAVSDHLGIFDEVIASDGFINLAGKEKAKALVARYDHAGFDYVGNSKVDIPVWQCARKAMVVNATAKLAEKAQQSFDIEQVLPSSKKNFGTWCRVLCAHQWLKNLLLFIPLLAAHQITGFDHWMMLIIAFFAISLCSSSIQVEGIASGFAAVLVLRLYIHSDVIMKLYKRPEFLWAEVPILLFWINWMWLQAHRGKMDDDPLVFAVKDRVSVLAGLSFSVVLIFGALGLW